MWLTRLVRNTYNEVLTAALLDRAICAADQAIAALEATDTRLELGRAFYQRALIRRRFEQTAAIHRDATRARELFAACGALRDLERAEEMLQRSAHDERARSVEPSWYGLDPI